MHKLLILLVLAFALAFPASAAFAKELGPNGRTLACMKRAQLENHISDEQARHLPEQFSGTIDGVSFTLKRPAPRSFWAECWSRVGAKAPTVALAPVLAPKAAPAPAPQEPVKAAVPTAQPAAALAPPVQHAAPAKAAAASALNTVQGDTWIKVPGTDTASWWEKRQADFDAEVAGDMRWIKNHTNLVIEILAVLVALIVGAAFRIHRKRTHRCCSAFGLRKRPRVPPAQIAYAPTPVAFNPPAREVLGAHEPAIEAVAEAEFYHVEEPQPAALMEEPTVVPPEKTPDDEPEANDGIPKKGTPAYEAYILGLANKKSGETLGTAAAAGDLRAHPHADTRLAPDSGVLRPEGHRTPKTSRKRKPPPT